MLDIRNQWLQKVEEGTKYMVEGSDSIYLVTSMLSYTSNSSNYYIDSKYVIVFITNIYQSNPS